MTHRSWIACRIVPPSHTNPVFVEVGQLYGDHVAVRGPLEPGDEVVITGLGSLTPGQSVEILR